MSKKTKLAFAQVFGRLDALEDQANVTHANAVTVIDIVEAHILALDKRFIGIEDRLAGYSLELERAVKSQSALRLDDQLLTVKSEINTMRPVFERAKELVELAPKVQKQIERVSTQSQQHDASLGKAMQAVQAELREIDKRHAAIDEQHARDEARAADDGMPERPEPDHANGIQRDAVAETPILIGDEVELGEGVRSTQGTPIPAGWHKVVGARDSDYQIETPANSLGAESALYWLNRRYFKNVRCFGART